MHFNKAELKDFLNSKYEQYHQYSFIESDPISIPHQFSKKEDIEISGFLTATISWGQRPTIIRNAQQLMALMDNAPFDFILNATTADIRKLNTFKHRTFNAADLSFFLKSLQNIYHHHGGLQHAFKLTPSTAEVSDLKNSIAHFRKLFFSIPHPARTQKHISNPMDNSAAKRLCMFLRWMVRNDKNKIDFGIWKIPSSILMCPLDVHSGNVSRKLNLLTRKQNDWKAVTELTDNLKILDPDDPVKYDYALFGLGVFENF